MSQPVLSVAMAQEASLVRHLALVEPVRACPRAEGETGPCVFIRCCHHLWNTVDSQGHRLPELVRSDMDPDVSVLAERLAGMPETCAIDVARRCPDGVPLADVGVLLGGVSRERVRQLEARAKARLATRPRARQLLQILSGGPARYSRPIEPSESDLQWDDLVTIRKIIERRTSKASPLPHAARKKRDAGTRDRKLLAFVESRGAVNIAQAFEAMGFSTAPAARSVLARLVREGRLEQAGLRGVYRLAGSSAQPTAEQAEQVRTMRTRRAQAAARRRWSWRSRGAL